MAKRTPPSNTRPTLDTVPPEAILVDRLERLMRDISLVISELKATIPQPNRPRPNAQALIKSFGNLDLSERGR